VQSRGPVVSHLMNRVSFQCDRKMFREEAEETCFTDGTKRVKPEPVGATEWLPVRAGTIGENAMKFLCSWQPK
jgi:hypothetical protein